MHITFKLKKKKKTLIPGRFLHKLMLDRYMVELSSLKMLGGQ